jgi:hypothetical protein
MWNLMKEAIKKRPQASSQFGQEKLVHLVQYEQPNTACGIPFVSVKFASTGKHQVNCRDCLKKSDMFGNYPI